MAYDEGLAERIRDTLSDLDGTTEMKMFGGLAFLLNGNMAVGIVKDDLMVRVGVDAHDGLLALPGARPMDFSGRPMKGYLYVASAALEDDADLAIWVRRGVAFAQTLPPK